MFLKKQKNSKYVKIIDCLKNRKMVRGDTIRYTLLQLDNKSPLPADLLAFAYPYLPTFIKKIVKKLLSIRLVSL
jgi:hypothetical protein